MGQQGFVADALVGTRLGWLLSDLPPHILEEAAGAHAQHVTGERYRPALYMPRYPGVLHFETHKKYAVAFPRTSRSIRRLAFLARSLASSICFWAHWLVASTLELALVDQAHPIVQRLLRDAQYLGRDSWHLTTLDQTDLIQLEFEYVPCPWL